ncbi:flavin reductase family protein [Massilia sp. TS11]|uniref:flavin reductase family protein n=1 Tax=Massilia sp. TS11 TaxID=2908003 RepID=UPI001EDC851D|nr:flavin reductase family protein [Massilia sp. TS11]MCG2586420.1 flavin reductase family protein [Massilia sp. TS11]
MNTSSPRATEPSFDSVQFRRALGQFATGVTVITTRLADGSYRGLTASSFNSVSLTPPLVLWSLGAAANSLPIFSGNSHYVINVLSAEQAHLAERFARRSDNPFGDLAFRLSRTGLPIIEGAAAWFECHNRSQYPEGDHVIFVGEVEACGYASQPALLFHNGQFSSTPMR